MYPFVSFLGRDFSMYGIMLLLGIALSMCLLFWLCNHKKNLHIIWWEAIPTAAIGFAGAIVGALLLRPLMKLPEVLLNWEGIYSQYPPEDLINYLFGEIVFYGGLIGGVVGVVISCKRLIKKPTIPVFDLFAPVVALGHSLGRVGCFLGGCCYGMEVSPHHPFAVIYPDDSLFAPPGTPLLAVPLIESCCLVIIAAILTVIYLKTNRTGITIGLYFALYAILRFTIEFFRGDLVRGVFWGISTSQFISIGIFIAGVLFFFYALCQRKTSDEISQGN